MYTYMCAHVVYIHISIRICTFSQVMLSERSLGQLSPIPNASSNWVLYLYRGLQEYFYLLRISGEFFFTVTFIPCPHVSNTHKFLEQPRLGPEEVNGSSILPPSKRKTLSYNKPHTMSFCCGNYPYNYDGVIVNFEIFRPCLKHVPHFHFSCLIL